MLEVALLYLFLVVFIIILFYMILLYSDYDTSILYRSNKSSGDTTNSLISTSALLTADSKNIEFYPNTNFRKRKIYGKIKLIMSSSSEVDVKLRIIDAGNNNEVIGDETTFTLFSEQTFGTTTAAMSFESSELSGSNAHQIQVHASSDTPGTVKLHDAVIYYY